MYIFRAGAVVALLAGGASGLTITPDTGDAAPTPQQSRISGAASSPGEPVVRGDALHDEDVDGDLSDDPGAPTPLGFSVGSNVVLGDVTRSNAPDGDRDFITFVVPNGQAIVDINLLEWDPDNLGFVAVNEGATSFIPSGETDGEFLSGILVGTGDVGEDLLGAFVDEAVTINSLSEPRLGPGTYSFVIQQTSDLVQQYGLDFVLAETDRQVQIRSIDFDAGIIEVFNFGEFDVDLTGWRFCSHDFDQARRYTAPAGLDGVVIESGTSVFVYFNNDAPAKDPDRINRFELGGGFATPLDQDAFAIQLFFPDENGNVSFGNSSLIADHLQWNVDGQGAGSAETRTAQAVSEGLWSAIGDFIATQADSTRIDLTDLSGDVAGSPDEYEVAGGADCTADWDGNGVVNAADVGSFLSAYFLDLANGTLVTDFDGNGIVNAADVGSFLSAYFGQLNDPECTG